MQRMTVIFILSNISLFRYKDLQEEAQKLRHELTDAQRNASALDKELKTAVTDKITSQQKVSRLYMKHGIL